MLEPRRNDLPSLSIRRPVMVVAVHMPLLAVQFQCQGNAQNNQEHPHARFCNEFKFFRDMKPGDENNRSDEQ